jgi:hypothetical protein
MPFDSADAGLLALTLLLQEATTAAQEIGSAGLLGSFPAGLATGIIAALLGLAGKYLMDYRLQSRRLALDEKRYGSEDEQARWRLQAEARHEVYAVVGSTQSNFVRAAMELHDRLSNFLENPYNTRPWLRGRTTQREQELVPAPEKDGYYLREFMRRIFNFYTWGRIAQDAINSLPLEVMREREDLQRLYTFVNLANSLITYTWLFRGVKNYEDRSENLHLFTGNLARLTEMGARIWKQNDGLISRESFEEVYDAGESPLMSLRDMLVATNAEEDDLHTPNRRAAFLIARLAVLRAILGAYLRLDHAWAFAMREGRTIAGELEWDLDYANSLAPDEVNLSRLVQRNLGELIERYRCEWLHIDVTDQDKAPETASEGSTSGTDTEG